MFGLEVAWVPLMQSAGRTIKFQQIVACDQQRRYHYPLLRIQTFSGKKISQRSNIRNLFAFHLEIEFRPSFFVKFGFLFFFTVVVVVVFSFLFVFVCCSFSSFLFLFNFFFRFVVFVVVDSCICFIFAKLSPAQSNFNSVGWAEIALIRFGISI